MKKNRFVVSLVGLALLSGLSAAHAHRTWLLPSVGLVDDKGGWVTFDAAVSEDLFVLGANAVKLDGLVITAPDGSKLAAANPFTGKLRSTFDLQLTQEGTYRVSIVSESAMASYKLGTETKRWRGAVADMAKQIPADAQDVRSTITRSRLETFVVAIQDNDTALKPVGKGLEVLPLSRLDSFAPGAPARFRVLLDGKPMPGLTVAVVPGGVRHRGVLREQAVKTDDQGEFSVTWLDAGMYAISASHPPRAAQTPAAAATAAPSAPAAALAQPAVRHTYMGTVEVLPE